MESGDFDTNIARYCLIHYHRFPYEYMKCSRREKALLAAMIHEEIRQRKKESADLKRKKR